MSARRTDPFWVNHLLSITNPSRPLAESNSVHIQRQDRSGIWRTTAVTANNAQLILNKLQQLKLSYPNQRVRAVDAVTGQLLDMLP
jgi:hypothetical protein